MAAGTITLTKSPLVSPPKTRVVRVFLETGGDNFNPNRCLSGTQFILNPNQQCVVITNMMAFSVKLNMEDLQAPLEFEPLSSQRRMCYNITIKQPGMALIVGEKTPLTLLLNSGCIFAEPFCATHDQWFELYSQQDLYPQKRAASQPTVDSPAAKKVCL